MQFEPDKEMHDLYQRFVQSIANQSDMSVYSEDDLLDIYDFSRSIPDDYVAMEVLIAGSRMYPASEDLAKRKVFFFHDFEQDSAVVESASILPSDSLTRVVTEFKANKPASDTDAKNRLARMLQGIPKRTIEDGDVYFMIETLNDLGLLDVVSDLAPRIAEYCAYPTTLYQELYKIYSEKGDTVRALAHCQALTVDEPFESRWWELLANAYTNLADDKDAALEAIDYALALNPEAVDARLLKATLMAADDRQDAIRICEDVLRSQPEYRPALFLGAYLYFVEHRQDEALQLLRRYAKADDESIDRNFFEMLFENLEGELPADIATLLDEYVAQLDLPEVYLWALQLSDNKLVSGAARVLSTLSDQPDFLASTPMVRLLAEAYYRMGRYDAVTELIDKMPEGAPSEDLLVTLYYALGRYRQGNTEGLVNLLESRLNKSTLVVMEGLAASERNMMLRGVRHHLVSLIKALMSEDIPQQAFDPFAE